MTIYRYYENQNPECWGLNYTEDLSKAAVWLIQGKSVGAFDHSTEEWKPVRLDYEIKTIEE